MTRIDQLLQQMIAETSQQVLPTVYSATMLAGLQELKSLTSAIAEQRAFAKQSAQAASEGWKLVPVDPTDEMVAAGDSVQDWPAYGLDDIYRAMLAAAPEYTAQEGKNHE